MSDIIDSILDSSDLPRSTFEAPVMSDAARVRAEAAEAAWAGETFEREGEARYAYGTALATVGVERMREERARWEARPLAGDALAELVSDVRAERRHDTVARVRDLRVTASGDLAVLLPGEAGPERPKGLGSLLIGPEGISDLMARAGVPSATVRALHAEAMRGDADAARIMAAVLNHWLARASEDARTMVRSRFGVGPRGAVAGLVGPDYARHDADATAELIHEALRGVRAPHGGDARAVVSYDGGTSSAWSVDVTWASQVSPEGMGVGEAHQIGVRFSSDDAGKGALAGHAMMVRLACLNASEFTDRAFGFRVVHRGDVGWRGQRRVVSAVRQGIVRAMAGAERALAAWGVACRAPLHVVPAMITRYDIDGEVIGRVSSGIAADAHLEGRALVQAVLTGEARALVGGSGAELVERMLAAYDAEPGDTLASVANALTRAAHDGGPLGRDLERRAGQIVLGAAVDLAIA